MPSRSFSVLSIAACALLLHYAASVSAQPATGTPPADQADAQPTQTPEATAPGPASTVPADRQAELESKLSKMLSGATLHGSYNTTARGGDPGQLRTDKYTLGEVSKIGGKMWRFQAQIQYREGENDLTIPIIVPIEWAADTPVIVLDNLTIPGMGTFSARVMFFADHYAGWWQHGERGGNLFGLILPAGAAPAAEAATEQPAQ